MKILPQKSHRKCFLLKEEWSVWKWCLLTLLYKNSWLKWQAIPFLHFRPNLHLIFFRDFIIFTCSCWISISLFLFSAKLSRSLKFSFLFCDKSLLLSMPSCRFSTSVLVQFYSPQFDSKDPAVPYVLKIKVLTQWSFSWFQVTFFHKLVQMPSLLLKMWIPLN